MSKVVDIFKTQDGGKILDTKFAMRIKTFPSAPVTVEMKGAEKSVYPFEMEHRGQVYSWDLDESQKKRIFTKSDKDGKVTWQAKEGDIVHVSLNSPRGNAKFPFYTAEPTSNDEFAVAELDSTPAPVTVSGGGERVVRRQEKAEPTKWDGTPREGNYRAGYCALLAALLSSGRVDFGNTEELEAAKATAKALVMDVRATGKELSDSYPDL